VRRQLARVLFRAMISVIAFRRPERWAFLSLCYYPIFWTAHLVGDLPPGRDHVHQVVYRTTTPNPGVARPVTRRAIQLTLNRKLSCRVIAISSPLATSRHLPSQTATAGFSWQEPHGPGPCDLRLEALWGPATGVRSTSGKSGRHRRSRYCAPCHRFVPHADQGAARTRLMDERDTVCAWPPQLFRRAVP